MGRLPLRLRVTRAGSVSSTCGTRVSRYVFFNPSIPSRTQFADACDLQCGDGKLLELPTEGPSSSSAPKHSNCCEEVHHHHHHPSPSNSSSSPSSDSHHHASDEDDDDGYASDGTELLGHRKSITSSIASINKPLPPPPGKGFELCAGCIEEHGREHARAFFRSRGGAAAVASRVKGEVGHTFRERVWAGGRWKDVEYDDASACSTCNNPILANRYKCVSCQKFDLCKVSPSRRCQLVLLRTTLTNAWSIARYIRYASRRWRRFIPSMRSYRSLTDQARRWHWCSRQGRTEQHSVSPWTYRDRSQRLTLCYFGRSLLSGAASGCLLSQVRPPQSFSRHWPLLTFPFFSASQLPAKYLWTSLSLRYLSLLVHRVLHSHLRNPRLPWPFVSVCRDLCQNCEGLSMSDNAMGGTHQADHIMMKVRRPVT